MPEDYFYANACHVCKRTNRKVTLTKCQECCMISYCSEEHMSQDRENHRELCQTINIYILLVFFYAGSSRLRVSSPAKWMRFKYLFMTTVQKILRRPLLKFEKQMFMFLKSCVTCHQHLDPCVRCLQHNFCHDRLNLPSDRAHEINSAHMALCFLFDNSSDWIHQIADMSYIKHIPDYRDYDWTANGSGMLSFIINYVKPYVNFTTYKEKAAQVCFHSHQVAAPLTLLYTMKEIAYTHSKHFFIVYVITDEFLDAASLRSWEIILHFMPTVTSMLVISIGPNLKLRQIAHCVLCERCRSHKNRLSYASTSDLRRIIESYTPHLILSFNARIYENVAKHINLRTYDYISIYNWKYIIKYLGSLRIGPIILTCYNQDEANENISAIDNILNAKQCIKFRTENKFGSLKPERNPETEIVLYQNSYIIAYQCFNDCGPSSSGQPS